MNISHVNIVNMEGRDQSQVKIKFKKFEKVKSVPKDVPESHNDDSQMGCGRMDRIWVISAQMVKQSILIFSPLPLADQVLSLVAM